MDTLRSTCIVDERMLELRRKNALLVYCRHITRQNIVSKCMMLSVCLACARLCSRKGIAYCNEAHRILCCRHYAKTTMKSQHATIATNRGTNGTPRICYDVCGNVALTLMAHLLCQLITYRSVICMHILLHTFLCHSATRTRPCGFPTGCCCCSGKIFIALLAGAHALQFTAVRLHRRLCPKQIYL